MSIIIDDDSTSVIDRETRPSSLIVPSNTIDREDATTTPPSPTQPAVVPVKESHATSSFVISDPSPSLLASISSVADQCAVSLAKPEVQVKLRAIVVAATKSPGTGARMQALSDLIGQMFPSDLVPSSRAVVTSLIALHCSSLPPIDVPFPPLITQTQTLPWSLLPGDDNKRRTSCCCQPTLTPSDTVLPELQSCKTCKEWKQQRDALALSMRILGDKLANKQAECERLRTDVLAWQDRLAESRRQEAEVSHSPTRSSDAHAKVARVEKPQSENKRRRAVENELPQ